MHYTRYIVLILITMLSVADNFAQKKTPAIHWNRAGEIPPLAGQNASLGVAGPVAGVDGKIIVVAGGANFPDSMPWEGGHKKYYNNIYLFQKKAGQLITLKTDVALAENIAYAACCSTPKGVLYAGGENETGLSDKVFLLKWNDAVKNVVTEKLPALPYAVTNAAAASYNNIVFIAGGEGRNNVSRKCWSIDLNNTVSGWKELAQLPQPVSHAVLVTLESAGVLKLYLIGGRNKTASGISELYNTVYELSPGQEQWKELPVLPYALSAGTGAAYGTSGIFLFGGDRGTTFTKVETCIAAINKATNDREKQELTRQKNQLLESHPGFSKEILYYNINSGRCLSAGFMPYPVPVTTTAFWWKKSVVIPGGEVKAGVRTPQVLIATIKRRVQ
ncbi:MAG TPA: hypothetical protein VFV31_04800 [Chitinophagaceae bacterium]|nr:hypothetical protein [Chitinophagaceae bacterium]